MVGADGIARRRRSWVGPAVGLVAILFCSRSGPPALCAENDKAVARARYETATRLYDLREYGKALEEYKAAYLAKPDPAFLFNIGQCFRKLGNTASALEFYEQYLRKTPPEEPNRVQAEARIRDIENGRNTEGDPFAGPEEKVAPPPPAQATHSPQPEPAPTLERVREPALAPPVPVSAPVPLVTVAQPPSRDHLVPATPSTADVASQRVYARWWFWTGIGVALVGGTVAAILLAQGGSESNRASTTLGTQAAFQ